MNAGPVKAKPRKTGIEEIRAAANTSKWTQEWAFDGLTAEACLALIRACWSSGYEILPDELDTNERRFAAKHGRLSADTLHRLVLLHGPAR